MNIERSFPYWDEIEPKAQELLKEKAALHSLEQGKSLGSGNCQGVLLLVEGRLRCCAMNDDGNTTVLCRSRAGELSFCLSPMLISRLRSDIVVTAEQDASFYIIPPSAYRAACNSSKSLASYSREVGVWMLADIITAFEKALWTPITTRLADFLCEEAEQSSSPYIYATHEQIAVCLGTAREVITRSLQNLKENGIISLSRGVIKIEDARSLKALRGEKNGASKK